MKRIFIILALMLAFSAAITSCTSSKVGCKANAGMVGYH